jgi:PhnB protein
MTTVTPHIVVREAGRAAAWYEQALGASIGNRIGRVLIADEFPEFGAVSPLTLGGTYGALTISVDDADAAWQRALAAGATEFHPLEDAFWGERHGQILDPFGHRWGLAQVLEEVPPEEVQRRATALFGGEAG